MASYAAQALIIKKSAALLLLLLGIIVIVIGLFEDVAVLTALGTLAFLGGLFLMVLKIVRRNQGTPA
jgi:uncharacterized membrane protein HdeD (DUF308 family)